MHETTKPIVLTYILFSIPDTMAPLQHHNAKDELEEWDILSVSNESEQESDQLEDNQAKGITPQSTTSKLAHSSVELSKSIIKTGEYDRAAEILGAVTGDVASAAGKWLGIGSMLKTSLSSLGLRKAGLDSRVSRVRYRLVTDGVLESEEGKGDDGDWEKDEGLEDKREEEKEKGAGKEEVDREDSGWEVQKLHASGEEPVG